MRALCAVWLLWLLVPVVRGEETRGAASFVAPSGWAREVRAELTTYTRVANGGFCQLAVYDAQPARGAVQDSFGAVWAGVFARNFVQAPAPASVQSATSAGFQFLVGEGEVTDLNRNRFYARLAMFLVPGNGVQAFLWIATNKTMLAGCEAEGRALMESVRYGAAGAGAVAASGGGEAWSHKFAVPAGWTEFRKGNVVTISPVKVQGAEQLAIVLLPHRPGGPLEREMGSTWNEIVAGFGAQPMRNVSGQAFDLEAARRTVSGWDYVVANGGIRFNSQAFSVRAFLFRVRDRIERVYVIAADFRAGLTMMNAMTSPRFEPEIYRFIFSLNMDEGRGAAAREAPAAEGPGIEGVWGGLGMSFGSIQRQSAIFFRDGSAFFGAHFPTNGVADLDPAIEREREPRYWGNWTMNGATGTLRMPYGEIPMRRDGEVLVLTTTNTEHRYIRIPTPSAAALAGTWCLGGGGPCLALSGDGRFHDEGVLRVIEHQPYPYPISQPRGDGRFQIRPGTLIFQYEGGGEYRAALPGPVPDKPGAGPAQIWVGFNFDTLTRR